LLGGLVHRHRAFWLWLGRLESSVLAEKIRHVPIRAPIFVCGLARSGSTLLHEFLASYPGLATHRVKDYPMLFTPYWWRRAMANSRPQPPRERVHRDGLMITPDSPDALEEMLWMSFFPRCHDPSVSCVLTARESHPEFESFYTAHLRKLLLAEGGRRYVAKANYHVARLSYLTRLFPDVRFIIPVRSPAGQIASLVRQQQWFAQGQRRHRAALAYMRRSGHFEFGLDRRPMHLGDSQRVRRILAAWAAGDELRGLALYWDMVYGYLARLLASDPAVRKAALVVPFETLCSSPAATLRAVVGHTGLAGTAYPDAGDIIERQAQAIRFPTYYDSTFSRGAMTLIHTETAATAGLWGYG
jgi:hypothetical protein